MGDFAAVIRDVLVIHLRSALALTQVRIGLPPGGTNGFTPTDGTRLALTDGTRLGGGVLELQLLPLQPFDAIRRLQQVGIRARGR